MKEFYFIYREKTEDVLCKYVNISAIDILNAVSLFKEQLPNVIFCVVYDKAIYPFLEIS